MTVFIHVRALERYRLQAGFTVQQVLSAANVTSAELARSVREQAFGREEAQRLAHALCVPVRELLTTSTVMRVEDQLQRSRRDRAENRS